MIHTNICRTPRREYSIYSTSFYFRIFSLVMASNENLDSTSNTAASSLTQLLLNEINKQDVNGLLHVQTTLLVNCFAFFFSYVCLFRLDQLDKTNEKLDSINKLSAQHYIDASRNFANHTQLLTTMKSDLDLIFKRIKYDRSSSFEIFSFLSDH